MEDLERGERIKALREERRLTQPAVVELFEGHARRGGWEPKAPGQRPLTLRGYQAWEAGGGIKWDNAKLLAEIFEVDPEFVMSGRAEVTQTPDLFAGNHDGDLHGQLDRIEAKLDQLLELLRPPGEDGRELPDLGLAALGDLLREHLEAHQQTVQPDPARTSRRAVG